MSLGLIFNPSASDLFTSYYDYLGTHKMQTIATVFFLFRPRLTYEITVIYYLLTVMKFRIFLIRIIKIF